MRFWLLATILLVLTAPVTAATWPWCADQDIFFWNSSSDVSGYRVMDHIPQLSDQRSVTSPPVSTSTGEVTLGTWVTPAGSPGVSQIGPGLFRFRTYAYTSSASGKTWIKFYVINRSASGTETVLFFGNAITRDIDATTVPTEYLTSYARRNYTTMFSGDRLAIRVNASTDSAAARTVTMEVAGNTNASMVSVSYFLCGEISNPGYGSVSTPPPVMPVAGYVPVIALCLAALALMWFKR